MTSEHYATDFVAYYARTKAQASAIEDVVTGDVITWSSLDDKVAGLAGALAEDFGAGLGWAGLGDRVAVLAANHPWSLILELACMRLGAVYVPLNFRLVQSELEFLCSDSEPAVLIHDAAHQEMATRVAGAAGVPRLASFGAENDVDGLESASRSATPRSANRVARMTDTVQLIYTSGTTGRPKGAIVTHQTLHYQTLNSIEPCELSSSSKYLAVLPFFHAGGLNSMTNPILSLGGTVAVAPGFDPAQAVALGETGEVWVHGPSIVPGYWRRNRADDPAFAGEWFRSGDAVTQDRDGYLTMVDRIKDMYKSGGENVYPAEIERVLQSHSEIADAAVIPIVHERWGEVGRALLVAKPGVELDTDSVREHCRKHLAKFKVPDEFVIVEPFERNGSGKLPKADLKKKYGSGFSTVAPRLAPTPS